MEFPSDEKILNEAQKQAEQGSTLKQVQKVYAEYFIAGINWLKDYGKESNSNPSG